MLLSLLSFPAIYHTFYHTAKQMIRFSTTWFSFTNLFVCVLFSSSARSGASELLDFTGAFRLLSRSLLRQKGCVPFLLVRGGCAPCASPMWLCALLFLFGEREAQHQHTSRSTQTHKTPTAQRPLSALALPFLNRCAWRFRAFLHQCSTQQ